MIKILYTNDQQLNEKSTIEVDTVNPKKEPEIIKIDHGTVSIKIAVEEQEFTSMDDSEENEAEKRVILNTYYLHVESNFDSQGVTGKQPIAENQEGELHVGVKNNVLSIIWNSGEEPIILIRTHIPKKIVDAISNKQGQGINPQSHWSPSDTIPYDESRSSEEFSEQKETPSTGDDAKYENNSMPRKSSCNLI